MSDRNVFLKKFRLLRKGQFQAIKTSPITLTKRFFVLHQSANALNFPRLGILLYKKKFPLAVERNHLKRKVRESFRLYRPLLKGYDIVISVRQEASTVHEKELDQCLEQLFLESVNLS